MNIITKEIKYEIPKDTFIENDNLDELVEHITELDMLVQEYENIIEVLCNVEDTNLLKDTLKIYTKEEMSFSDSKLDFLDKINNHIRTINYSLGEHLYSILQPIAIENSLSMSFLLNTDDKKILKQIDTSIKKENG